MMRQEKIRLAKTRMQSGYYNDPRVQRITSSKVLRAILNSERTPDQLGCVGRDVIASAIVLLGCAIIGFVVLWFASSFAKISGDLI